MNPFNRNLDTISCEAIFDHNHYCWSWFSARCGTNNDITVEENIPFFIDLLAGNIKLVLENGYELNGSLGHLLLYYLVDVIYQHWEFF